MPVEVDPLALDADDAAVAGAAALDHSQGEQGLHAGEVRHQFRAAHDPAEPGGGDAPRRLTVGEKENAEGT